MPLNLYFILVIIIFSLVVIIYIFNKYMNRRFIQAINTMEREVDKYKKDQNLEQETKLEDKK